MVSAPSASPWPFDARAVQQLKKPIVRVPLRGGGATSLKSQERLPAIAFSHDCRGKTQPFAVSTPFVIPIRIRLFAYT